MIVYKMDMFDKNQTVYVTENNKIIQVYKGIPFNDVDTVLVNYCYQHNDFRVKIMGPLSYSAKIRDNILAKNTLDFKNQHIIEVEI